LLFSLFLQLLLSANSAEWAQAVPKDFAALFTGGAALNLLFAELLQISANATVQTDESLAFLLTIITTITITTITTTIKRLPSLFKAMLEIPGFLRSLAPLPAILAIIIIPFISSVLQSLLVPLLTEFTLKVMAFMFGLKNIQTGVKLPNLEELSMVL